MTKRTPIAALIAVATLCSAAHAGVHGDGTRLSSAPAAHAGVHGDGTRLPEGSLQWVGGVASATSGDLASGSAATHASGAVGGLRSGSVAGRRSAGLYGGGAFRDFVHFVSFRLARSRTRFDAHATLVTKCGPRFGDGLVETIAVTDGQLSTRGAYRASASFSDEVAPGVPEIGGLHTDGTIDFSARVQSGGVAVGTARARTTYRDPQTGSVVSRCDTGTIGWTARLPAGGAGRGIARLQPGAHFGTTAQGGPFLMSVVRQGRLIARAGMTFLVSCPSAVGLPVDLVANRVPVARDGSFDATGTFRRGFTLGDGTAVLESYAWRLRGRFGRRGAIGSFQVSGVVRRTSDRVRIGRCGTGRNHWRASG
jgi:hypothetical protein